MAEVKNGRVERLAVLFERHHIMLFNFFLRLTGNRSTSEDLVQEVFIRILKYRATYRGEDKFLGWMYRIAHNAHIDHLRRHKETVALDDQFVEAASLDDDSNVNVRLAAVDALYLFYDQPEVKEHILGTLAKQDSPLIQAALIDLLVGIRERLAVESLQHLLQDKNLNPQVKQKAVQGIQQLSS